MAQDKRRIKASGCATLVICVYLCLCVLICVYKCSSCGYINRLYPLISVQSADVWRSACTVVDSRLLLLIFVKFRACSRIAFGSSVLGPESPSGGFPKQKSQADVFLPLVRG